MGPTATSTISIVRRSDRRDARLHRSRKKPRPRGSVWFDVLIALGCLGGLTISTLYQVQVRTADFGASDFKTLYASVWCFAHRISAYTLANIQQVFVANGVVQPPNWFGHAPVYPWTTLAFLSPLAWVGMVPACYILTILSGALMAVAAVALMRYAANSFDLGPAWRVVLAVLFTAEPLVGFGINMGNVSVAASALCMLAFLWREPGTPWIERGSRWVPAAALASAFVLKPHLALWVGIGMFLLPERAARAVVVRAAAVVAGFTVLTTSVMIATGTLGLQTRDYLAMLAAEASAGSSMSAQSRAVLPVVSEITSLNSILGFWIANPVVRIALTFVALLVLGLLTLRLTRRVDSERAALLGIGAWCALGLLATYHRTADAMMLLLLLPWALDRVRRTPKAWYTWAAVALYLAMSVSVGLPTVGAWVDALPTHSPLAFLLLRQAGLADFLLLLVLLFGLKREQERQVVLEAQFVAAGESQAAA